ncbi:MAG: hypothetical protein HOD54_01120 [Candidatus Magasanikbacteria bacterium]|jgi:hypothetical protein|nr:hypothetical protein [Candidatus Magasanikbacteria bacterium]MBT4314673.1 hypothetical protein [Candidatus Magasanikbacteria bacterium]MBT4547093.1 hypothetical protein [Candidatus Magasanikbacteria bacterium]
MYKLTNYKLATAPKEKPMKRFVVALFSLLLLSCIPQDQLITHDSAKILKDTRKVEVPPYFTVSFLDHSWFKWATEVAGASHLEKELDKCQRLLRKPTNKLVDTCRRAWMLEVWMTHEPENRRHLAIQKLNSMHALMQVNGWSSDKIQRYLEPFEVEIDLSPTP